MDTLHPFAEEVSMALDSIEALTRSECAAIIRVVNETGAEPLFAFLALHHRLAYVLASPHGNDVRAILRSWGANKLIDQAIWKEWGPCYRALYRSGVAATPESLMSLSFRSDDLIGASAPAQPTRPRQSEADRRAVIEGLRPGDVFRWRVVFWPADHWSEEVVVKVSVRGNLVCHRTGRKTTRALSFNDKNQNDYQVELVRRSAGNEPTTTDQKEERS